MNKFILSGAMMISLATGRAQDAASTPRSSPDVDELRQQVQALTGTVKDLQQQVKDQQTTINKLNQQNGAAPENPEPSPVAAGSPFASASAAPTENPPTKFATEDSSVVASSG